MELQIEGSNKKIMIDENMESLKKYKWHFHKAGYVRATINGRREFCHRIILNAKKGEIIDHINGDKLDNRRTNLRFCTFQQNTANSSKKENCISRFKGVRFDTSMKRRKRWMAACEHSGKSITIGRFKTQEQAAIAYNNKAKEIWGEFARFNVIELPFIEYKKDNEEVDLK